MGMGEARTSIPTENLVGRKKFGDGNRAEDSVKWDDGPCSISGGEEIEIAIEDPCRLLSPFDILSKFTPSLLFSIPLNHWILVP